MLTCQGGIKQADIPEPLQLPPPPPPRCLACHPSLLMLLTHRFPLPPHCPVPSSPQWREVHPQSLLPHVFPVTPPSPVLLDPCYTSVLPLPLSAGIKPAATHALSSRPTAMRTHCMLQVIIWACSAPEAGSECSTFPGKAVSTALFEGCG